MTPDFIWQPSALWGHGPQGERWGCDDMWLAWDGTYESLPSHGHRNHEQYREDASLVLQ